MLRKHHKRNIEKMAKRLNKKVVSARGSMVTRSAKYGVECNVTVEELRELTMKFYGTRCKYDKTRVLTINNLVYDHIVPISKGGTSNLDNIQIISRTSNNLKGSLSETDLYILLEWLDTVSEELRKDIKIRLAHGIH